MRKRDLTAWFGHPPATPTLCQIQLHPWIYQFHKAICACTSSRWVSDTCDQYFQVLVWFFSQTLFAIRLYSVQSLISLVPTYFCIMYQASSWGPETLKKAQSLSSSCWRPGSWGQWRVRDVSKSRNKDAKCCHGPLSSMWRIHKWASIWAESSEVGISQEFDMGNGVPSWKINMCKNRNLWNTTSVAWWVHWDLSTEGLDEGVVRGVNKKIERSLSSQGVGLDLQAARS